MNRGEETHRLNNKQISDNLIKVNKGQRLVPSLPEVCLSGRRGFYTFGQTLCSALYVKHRVIKAATGKYVFHNVGGRETPYFLSTLTLLNNE